MSLLDAVQAARGDITPNSTPSNTSGSSLLQAVQMARGNIKSVATTPTPASTQNTSSFLKIAPNAKSIYDTLSQDFQKVVKVGEDTILKFVTPTKSPISTQNTVTLPKKPLIISPDQKQLNQDQLQQIRPTSAQLKTTPNSLHQDAASLAQTKKVLDAINGQIDLTKRQVASGVSDLLNKGVVPNMNEVMPKVEYKNDAEYQKAVQQAKNNSFGKELNKQLGGVVATAPLFLAGGWVVDPITTKIASLIPDGTNILTHILSVAAKGGVKLAPYGAINALAPAKDTNERIKNTAIGIATSALIGMGVAGAGSIASELVQKFGQDAENFLANRELVQKVVNGMATKSEQKQFQILNESGLTAEAARTPGGISINAQVPKQGKMWDILRYIFSGHFIAPDAVSTKEKKITDLLPAGEITPQEVIGTVIKSGQENTTEGKALIKSAAEAQRQGQNIEINKPTMQQESIAIPGTTEAKKYTSAKDFADAVYAATPEHQIGLMDPKEITPRDPVDRNSAQYQALKADIEKNGIQEPIRIDATSNKPLTVDGSQRVSVAQDLGIKVPVIVNKGEIAGLKTIEQLYNEGNNVKPKTINVPGEQLPQGTGKEKISRLEARIKQSVGSMSQEVIDKLGLSTYKELNKQENIAAAAKYVAGNPEDALKVLRGELDAPKGILRNAIFVAMQNDAIGDVNLARKLASLQSTRLGQELSILTEIDPNSPIKIASDIFKIKEELFKKKYRGKSTSDVTKSYMKKGKSDIKAPSINDWSSLIKEVRC